MINKIICFFLGHKLKLEGRENGITWGWNYYTCKRCGTKVDDWD